MILSVSRRTDVPAFYAQWFMNRIREGYVMVRNPMNYHQVSRVLLKPDVIDCIVFWTKDPAPMVPYLDEIGERYPFYIQYTLNAYDRSVEHRMPPLHGRLETFRELSRRIGSERIIWRYDPVLLSDAIDILWHAEQFQSIAESLDGFTRTCVFSFIDLYDKIKNRIRPLGIRACSEDEMQKLAEVFAGIAAAHGMVLCTCAEKIDLSAYGIRHGACIDRQLIERLTGTPISAGVDGNQREACGCLESVDIGQYNTCGHGCGYCYANFNPAGIETKLRQHDPKSPFLVGSMLPGDKVTERKMKSLKAGHTGQMRMF